MWRYILLCVVVLSLAATALPCDRSTQDDRSTNENSGSWSFGYGSDEGGGGTSYLGVDIADVTAERLSALKLKEEHGAEVTMVDSDAPAGKAGLREHDVILSLNGTAIESAAQLRRMIKETPPGRVVTLGISRDGQPQTIKVQLADRHQAEHWMPNNGEFNFQLPKIPQLPDFDLPISVVIAHSSMRSGLMVENITVQLGDFFGVKDGNGVLVREVEKGSRGEKAGFRAGDVIVKVNSQAVHDTSDFTHALKNSSGNSAAVTVMRDKREQNLTLTLPEKKDSGWLQEDSFEIPDFTAETQLAIQKAENAMASVGPEIEKAQQEMLRYGDLQKRMQGCMQKQQQEIEKRLKDQGQKLRDKQNKLLEKQQKLRQKWSPDWAEI